ncbi:MAG TPA: aldo/keto reductase, partial [Terricaulis sp.]|nr:aldo/keto reductase [Terricaulis sp.]
MPIESSRPFGASRLGFGCAGLHGAVSAGEAETLLETALDHGVTHFDTARVYGWGAAEAMLGALAARRRHEMHIVSKAGIAPPSLAGKLLRKTAGRFVPALARAGAPRFGRFAAADITTSVEESLRALKTDRLDALLLHEIQPAHVTDELKRALQQLKASGKALRIGLATDADATS